MHNKSLIIIILHLNIFCAPIFFHRAPSFEQKSFQNSPDLYAVVQEFNYAYPASNLYKPKSKAIELLKKSVEVSIYNSGKYAKVIWKDSNFQAENFQKDEFKILMEITIEDHPFAYEYKHQGISDIFFYFPDQNSDEKFPIFWPGIIPIPYFGLLPFIPRAGNVQTELKIEIVNPEKKYNFAINAKEKYSMFVYGVYRTEEIEEATLVSIEKVLENFTKKIGELK